jgi:hypothetical protein
VVASPVNDTSDIVQPLHLAIADLEHFRDLGHCSLFGERRATFHEDNAKLVVERVVKLYGDHIYLYDVWAELPRIAPALG